MSQRTSKLSNKDDELDFFYGLEQLYSTVGKPEELEISCIIHMQQMHMTLRSVPGVCQEQLNNKHKVEIATCSYSPR